MTDELTTKPTIETVLERISVFDTKLGNLIDQLDSRFDQLASKVESRIDQLEAQMTARFEQVYIEIDRVASVAHSTKGEMLALRVEFRELRTQLKEVLPTPQTS